MVPNGRYSTRTSGNERGVAVHVDGSGSHLGRVHDRRREHRPPGLERRVSDELWLRGRPEGELPRAPRPSGRRDSSARRSSRSTLMSGNSNTLVVTEIDAGLRSRDGAGGRLLRRRRSSPTRRLRRLVPLHVDRRSLSADLATLYVPDRRRAVNEIAPTSLSSGFNTALECVARSPWHELQIHVDVLIVGTPASPSIGAAHHLQSALPG